MHSTKGYAARSAKSPLAPFSFERREPGPTDVQIDHDIKALGAGSHELCITVFGSDAGGTGSVTSCSPARADGGPLTSS